MNWLIRVVVLFVMLWVLVPGALALAQGWQSTLAQMGWFFTKAALLTFGGAYAVLPYVTDGAVTTHGWLTLPQMMDGLALFFAGHVFWPHGIEGVFDWPALLISAGAFIALWKFEVSVVRVIAACAVPGLLGMAL